jgi:hypothetical protein
MKKNTLFTSILHYSYYRYYLHLKKQWNDDKSISEFNLGFGYTYSAGALSGLIIFLIDDFFGIEKYVNTLIIVAISLLTICSFFLPKIDFLENKYKDYDRTNKEWKIRGFLSLTLVFGPPILLILYMLFRLPN